MALGTKRTTKSIYVTGSGNSSDILFLDAGTEASASASYARGDHIINPRFKHNMGALMYQLKLIDEDMEEIRRFATGSGEIDVDGGSF